MTRVLRAPLLHFLAIGGVLLALRSWTLPGDAPTPHIAMGTSELELLREAYTEEHGAPPGAAAEERLVRDAVDEEVLYREAVARGFDRGDATVRERLVRLGGFVGEEASTDREALERAARRLGLDRSDLVVRRHLVEMMRLATARLGPADMPSEEDLARYLAEHAAEFQQPARVRLMQVYFSADARGAGATADALAVLGELRGTIPDRAISRGDAFIRGSEFDGTSADLERVFGTEFSEAVEEAGLRAWTGPVRSTYGVHLVWVASRSPAGTPRLDEVRGRVVHRWLREHAEARARETMDRLRARYVVDVAKP